MYLVGGLQEWRPAGDSCGGSREWKSALERGFSWQEPGRGATGGRRP